MYEAAFIPRPAGAAGLKLRRGRSRRAWQRLRRWHRELTARDVFGAPEVTEANQQLKHCIERLAGYTERVFTALHQL